MSNARIEWTDKVWNPVTGCTKVSQGCRNCYAETIANRFFAKSYPPNADGSLRVFTDVRFHDDRLDAPLRWREKKCESCNGAALRDGGGACVPCKGTGKRGLLVFVNSMSDLFHEDVPFGFIDKVFAVMAHCSVDWFRCLKRNCDHEGCCDGRVEKQEPHTFQILTKRPAVALKYFTPDRHGLIIDAWREAASWCFGDNPPIGRSAWPLPNVWLGVSVENQHTADERIPLLLQTPASVRWVSAEPLLGPIQFHWAPKRFNERGVDWVVVGGESGRGARPMDPNWARSIRDQCQAAGVPFFFKQQSKANSKSYKYFSSFPIDLQVRNGFPRQCR